MNITIAVLMTCYNRREKTLKCLSHLFEAELPKGYIMDIFLVDDGSSDGTTKAINALFPTVKVIEGSGNLFWNQGMRLAWCSAFKQGNYDYYLWLNDDTILENNALINIFDNYKQVKKKVDQPIVLVGACKESKDRNLFSYGGRDENGPVIPNGINQECKYINGNIVLVPKEIFKKVGFLSKDYTHGMGDYDYGLRTQEMGFSCYTTKKYVAVCHTNKGTPVWCNPKKKLTQRWKHFHSPLGLNYDEYIKFRKRFWKQKWIIFAAKAYLKMLFPKLYNRISI